MTNYDIITITEEGEFKNGELNWDMASGNWSYNTDDHEIAEILQSVSHIGSATIRSSEIHGGAIFELANDVPPTDERFLDALKDMLLFTDFLDFNEIG